ncbi:MAG: YceD family protein [Actinomycetota bacterium]|nr:YceD family protein [Actinomycetota bacterium]
MAVPISDRVVKVADLLDQPGASRRVDLCVGPPDDLVLPLVDMVGPLRLAGVVESVVDGLLVRGRLTVAVQMACARCLANVEDELASSVTELFSDPARVDLDDEVEVGYEVREGLIDLDTLLRDALIPAVPYQPLCRADCLGLCASCGTNLNHDDCACVEAATDPRWSALEGLRLSDDAL